MKKDKKIFDSFIEKPENKKHYNMEKKNYTGAHYEYFHNEQGDYTIVKHQNSKEFYVAYTAHEKDAQIIVTAVNCTYGANIRPEGIEALVDSVTSLLNNFTAEQIAQVQKLDPEFYADFIIPISKALNNIKYKE